jgi:Tol biopolymer transport system component
VTNAAEPDRRDGLIAFEGGDGLYVIDANGGEARKIPGTLPRDGDPVWSPDGRMLAFDRGGENRDIYVMDADGSNQRQLTFAPEDDGWPIWAPHGRAVTFESDRDGVFAPYAINLERRQARRVAPRGEYPDWTTSGRIVFGTGDYNVVSVRPYGAKKRIEARSSSQLAFFAVRVSDDGKRIVFTNGRGAGEPHELFTARRDGSDAKLVFKSALEIYNPAWSPDGRWITFYGEAAGTDRGDVYVVRTDGSGLTRLTAFAPRGSACCSDWSATAKR